MPNIDRANKHNQTCSKAGEDENSTFSPAFDREKKLTEK